MGAVSPYHGQIVTLLIQEGEKGPFASYCPGRRRYLVRMPSNAIIGAKIRVKLIDRGHRDSRDEPIFACEPSPDETIEKWRENGDGTVSRVKVITNWLLEESEEVTETRPLATREGTVTVQTEQKSVLDLNDLVDSYVEEIRTKVIPIEQEYLYEGTILWKRISKREEPAGSDLYTVEKVELSECEWKYHRLDCVYLDSWNISLSLIFLIEKVTKTLRLETTWGEIPSWLQNQLIVPYPLCSCGRKRRDTKSVFDSYSKCELCRAEEHCDRCGKKQIQVTLIKGHLICNNCQPYQEAEDLINQLPSDRLESIATEAKNLLAANAVWDQEVGEMILRATVDHITSTYTRDNLIRKYSGYGWYYFCESGIFGTKFSREALQVLQLLPQASGNSLVELVLWLSEVPKPGQYDYFTSTQIRHEVVTLPMMKLKDVIRQLTQGSLHISDRLRDSEANRTAALAAFRKAEEELTSNLIEKSREALQAQEQDYKEVMSLIKAAYAEHARQKVLEDLLKQEYSTCPVCNEAIELNYRHHCSEQGALSAKGDFKSFTLKISRCEGIEIIKMEAVCDEYGRYILKVVDNSMTVSISDPIETELNWRQPSQQEKELAEDIQQLKDKLSAVETERNRMGRIELVFKLGANPRGEPQLQCNTRFTGEIRDDSVDSGFRTLQNQQVLFVARPNAADSSKKWICTIGRQIGITKDHLLTPIVVANPQLPANDQEILEEISWLQEELEAERKRQKDLFVDQPFDEAGNAKTALAQQFRDLGWFD